MNILILLISIFLPLGLYEYTGWSFLYVLTSSIYIIHSALHTSFIGNDLFRDSIKKSIIKDMNGEKPSKVITSIEFMIYLFIGVIGTLKMYFQGEIILPISMLVFSFTGMTLIIDIYLICKEAWKEKCLRILKNIAKGVSK